MSLNVLVVDDSAIMRRMIIRTLRLSGLRLGKVHEAENGRVGLMELTKNQIDLALVDINMPEMGGEEMIERVKRNPSLRGVPMIVVSTEGSETRIAALQREGIGFVHKPFTPEQLSKMILGITGECHADNSGNAPLSGGGPDF